VALLFFNSWSVHIRRPDHRRRRALLEDRR
jgi:hypothetical protein